MSDLPAWFKTKPFRHQTDVFEASKDRKAWALFLEMGLGKSKIILDTASYLFHVGKIDAVMIVAPNSVYRNWVSQEIPRHLAAPHIGVRYETNDSPRRIMKQKLLLDPSITKGKLRVLCMSYDSLRTERGFEYARKFTTIFRAMIVADESTVIKNHGAIITKRMKKLRERCHYARICTGTPAAQSPFDVHSQMEFLDPDFWADHGMRSKSAFSSQFGVFEAKYVSGGRKIHQCVGYRRIEDLEQILKSASSRLLKEDSGVELPPKLYSVRMFQMTKKQREIYRSVAEEFWAELDSSPGGTVEAPLAIVRLSRLQQIASGFVTADQFVDNDPEESFSGIDRGVAQESLLNAATTEFSEDDLRAAVEAMSRPPSQMTQLFPPEVTPREIKRVVTDVVPPEANPRLELLFDLIDSSPHKVIVWCRFRRSIELICETLGDKAVRYDGATSPRDREEALRKFRDPKGPKVFVANVHAISMGVTLNEAKTAIYYENSFSLEKRLQSEDRFHRIGQDQSVHVIDIAAEDSVDEKLIDSLRMKYDTAAMVTGDRLREWISRKGEDDEM